MGRSAVLKPGDGLQGAHGRLSQVHEGRRDGGAWSLRTETGGRPELCGAADAAAGVLRF